MRCKDREEQGRATFPRGGVRHDAYQWYQLRGDLLDLGTLHKIVNRSGAWFKYGETYLGQGKEKARNYLIENPKVAEEIKQLILENGGYVGAEGVEAAEEAVATVRPYHLASI